MPQFYDQEGNEKNFYEASVFVGSTRMTGGTLVVVPDQSPEFPGVNDDGSLCKGDMNYFLVTGQHSESSPLLSFVVTSFDGDPIGAFLNPSDAVAFARMMAEQITL